MSQPIETFVHLDDCLTEMKALIFLCETTESALIKRSCKQRLKVLSQIPKVNPFGVQMNERTISEYKSIKN